MVKSQILMIERISKLISDPFERNFAKALYYEVPVDALDVISFDDLAEAATSICALARSKSPHTSNISITLIGKEQEIRVVEVVVKDVPFLVESIGNELKRNGVIIHLVVHPTFSIKRNKEGEIVELNAPDGEKEAIMQFFIANHFGDDYYDKMKDTIRNIIECVDLVVQDWKPMQQLMKDAIKNIASKNWYQASVPEKKESVNFLEWLMDDHFIFLGSSVIDYEIGKVVIDPDNVLGMSKSVLYKNEISPIDNNIEEIIFIKKSNTRSVVHRDNYMNCIYVKQFDKKGQCSRMIVFMGFFTSSVYSTSVKNIPLIRVKVQNVLNRYGYHESNYNAKELITALEKFSRSDLVQISEDELFEIATGMVSLNLMPRVKVLLRIDKFSQLVHCFVFIPRSRFSSEIMKVVERILSQQIYGSVFRYYVTVGESQLARLQIVIKPIKTLKKEYNVKKIEELIVDATSVWIEDLSSALQNKFNQRLAAEKYNKFKDAFDLKYTSTFAAKQAVHDIKLIELAIAEKQVKFALYVSAKSGKDFMHLKIFSPSKELPLSCTLPTIENVGFFVVDTLTFKLLVHEGAEGDLEVFVHYFRLNYKYKDQCKNAVSFTSEIKKNIEITLEKVANDKLENDKFNALILYAGINWKEVYIIRAYAAYLTQINFLYDKAIIIENLIGNSSIVSRLVELFNARFSLPDTDLTIRESAISVVVKAIDSMLSAVPSLVTEKIFKVYIALILATKRTNFFNKISMGFEHSGISFKISSNEVKCIPLPRPFIEIFVYSSVFEAIHLRGGRIARGGLRWSDRRSDFRTEVLGLMKAQMTKNAVIVPVGSKGGFVLKRTFSDASETMKEGVKCYKDFLRGILDITDNIVNDGVMPPLNVVRYDGDDPYLVVAADKGTASFSDYANAVSKEYKFWLGDAFASGGSVGYDHKKMAITARGAWVSVQDHFGQLGLDVMMQPFTAIGIGDMSGDVFGNGLLLSNQYKLVAAFNHLHIFIDPNPDTEVSFQERLRLFNLPFSKWTDYDEKLISSGGGVFLRTAKSINISKEAQGVLGIDKSVVTPDELVKAILCAPVDLFWNGGIGTYVKAVDENNAIIGDKANDAVRINGQDLRCKVVAEGGNLGFTQFGRIEYSKNGGRINTDFIDNSAGVDCSDHEVNIKIAFADLIHAKKLSVSKRDELLTQMTDEVARLVLLDNKSQTLLISLEQHRGKQRLSEHFWLIKNLENRKELDRAIEMLPENDDFAEISNHYGKLTRPEIAVLVAYAKNSAIVVSMNSSKTLDKNLDSYLMNYFPQILQEKYADVLMRHKLKKEIIVTSVINEFVNILGCCLFHQLLDHGHDPIDIISAFDIAINVLGAISVWKEIESLAHKVPHAVQMTLFNDVIVVVERIILWLLQNHCYLENVSQSIDELKLSVAEFIEFYKQDSIGDEKRRGAPEGLLSTIYSMRFISNIFDTVSIAKQGNICLHDAVQCYVKLVELFCLKSFKDHALSIDLFSYMDGVALSGVVDEAKVILHDIALYHIKNGDEKITRFAAFYRDFITELLKNMNASNVISSAVLALKRLKEISHSL